MLRLATLAAATLLAGCGPNDVAVDNSCASTGARAGARLRFAVFGDVRPAQIDDTAGYPRAVVRGLFATIAARAPDFVVGTGDYMFASPKNAVAVDAQLDQLLDAERAFAGPVYHALGNHECTGATASNCPRAVETANMRAFMARLVPPGTATPYYRVDVDTGRGAAKLVFVAANAWSAAQAGWLERALADATAYTFVVRHEPPSSTEPRGVAESEAIIARHPLTLALAGHEHRYRRIDARHVISGNGGAPLSAGRFGFVLVELDGDGNVVVSEIDAATGEPSDTFTICAH